MYYHVCKNLQQYIYHLGFIIALNKDTLPIPVVLADKYTSFMRDVNEFDYAFTGYEADLEMNSVLRLADTYLKNSRGASTDLPQRQARLDSLITALIS